MNKIWINIIKIYQNKINKQNKKSKNKIKNPIINPYKSLKYLNDHNYKKENYSLFSKIQMLKIKE